MQEHKVLSFLITVDGPGSKYCYNKGDHHALDSIYFEIDLRTLGPDNKAMIEQRCWSLSSHKTGRSGNTRCTSFSSRRHLKKAGNFSPKVLEILAGCTREEMHIDADTIYVDEAGERRFAGSKKRLCRGEDNRCTKHRQGRSGYCKACYDKSEAGLD